jgi:hypothetical protein
VLNKTFAGSHLEILLGIL